MRLAICDDDPMYRAAILRLLKNILPSDDITESYCDGFELLEAAKARYEPFDVVLLDMQMPGMSGIETAVKLRKLAPDIIIVIISNFSKYALSSYDIHAYAYLIKPVCSARLRQVLKEIRETIQSRPFETLHIFKKDLSLFVPIREILYIESFDRILCLHTSGQTYKYYEKLRQAEDILTGRGFFRIHKSYLVNLAYVTAIDKSRRRVILYNGQELPIGRTRMEGLLSAAIAHKTDAQNKQR